MLKEYFSECIPERLRAYKRLHYHNTIIFWIQHQIPPNTKHGGKRNQRHNGVYQMKMNAYFKKRDCTNLHKTGYNSSWPESFSLHTFTF